MFEFYMFLICILISMYILYMHVFCLYIEEVLILLNMIDHCQRNVTFYLIARSLSILDQNIRLQNY